MAGISEELERLAALLEKGLINRDEFDGFCGPVREQQPVEAPFPPTPAVYGKTPLQKPATVSVPTESWVSSAWAEWVWSTGHDTELRPRHSNKAATSQ
jgi:hypothetical protein